MSRAPGLQGTGVLAFRSTNAPSAIARSRIDASRNGIRALDTVVSVRDTAVRLSGAGTGLSALVPYGSDEAVLDAKHVTVVGPGTGLGARAASVGGGAAVVTFVNSVMSGFATVAERNADYGNMQCFVIADHSVLPSGPAVDGLLEVDVQRVDDPRVRLRPRPRARFTLSEAAQVTVRVARKRPGGRSRTVATITRARGAGEAKVRIAGRTLRRAGRYRVRVVAVDAAGNRSAAAAVRLRVRPR